MPPRLVRRAGTTPRRLESREREARARGGTLRTNSVPWTERLARVAAAAGAERAALVAVGDDVAQVTSSPGDLIPADWPDRLGGGVIRRVARGNDPVTVDVAGAVADADGLFASALLVPLRGEPTVVLALFRREGGFAVEELARDASLGALLGELHEESRSRLRASGELENMRERIRASDDLRPALAHARDAAALAHAAAVAIAERFHAQATSVMLLANGELRIAGSFGLTPQVARDTRRRVGEGIAGWVAQRGRSVLLRGPVEDARFRGTDPEARDALSVPLRVGDDVLGVVNVKRPLEGTTFDESHLRALEAVAGDVAAALQQIEALERVEDDRRRAVAIAEIAHLAQSGDRRTAARLACEVLGFAAVGIETAEGVEVLHAEADATLQGADVVRVATPAGDVLLAPGPELRGDALAIAERVAPLLASGGPQPEPDRPARDRVPIPLRVFVVEDHPVMREGLRKVLERDGDMVVCGSAQTLAEALLTLSEARPAIVLTDLHLPDADEAEAVRRLAVAPGRAPVVVFTFDTAPDVVMAALRAGARGYVPKRCAPEELRAAVRAAASGILAIHPDVLPALQPPEPEPEPEPERPRTEQPHPATRDALTPRDLEYLRYLAEGYTNKEIARAMVLAEDTVKKGIQTLIAKLGAVDRTHAVVLALRNDLIE